MQFAQPVVVLSIVYGLKQIDTTEPEVIHNARILYGVAQAIVFLCYFIIKQVIARKNETEEIMVGPDDLEPPQPFAPKPEITLKPVPMTIREYDTIKLGKIIKQGLTSIAMVSFIHYKWGYVQPLVIQSVMAFFTLAQLQHFRIHLLGQKADSTHADLKRPWKPAPGMMDKFKDMQKDLKNGIDGEGSARKNKKGANLQKMRK